MTSHPDLSRVNIERAPTWRIVGAAIMVLGGVLLTPASVFAAVANYAVATILTGTANDAGFSFQLALGLAVAGFVVLSLGREVSVIVGLTHNWDSETNYKNGLDGNVDFSASQFVSETTHIRIVGYVYHQITGDTGSGAVLGDFKSRVSGIGPQVGHFFAVDNGKWYVSAKAFLSSIQRTGRQGGTRG